MTSIDGFAVEYEPGKDFRHFLKLTRSPLLNSTEVIRQVDPRVNLKPRYRYHRVYAVKDFIKSIEDLKSGKEIRGNKEQHYLWKDTEEHLNKIVSTLQQIHQGKKLEGFLAKVFRTIPGVTGKRKWVNGWVN